MAEEGPNNKAEIQEIFRRLRQSPANRVSKFLISHSYLYTG